MLTCEEFAEKVSDYLDGRVPYGQRIGIWVHALLCKPCRVYLDQMEKTVELMGEVDDQEDEDCKEPSEEEKEELLDDFCSKHG